MFLCINNLIHFNDVRMGALSPYFYLVINVFKVIGDFHFSGFRILTSSLFLEKRLVHHFHSEILFDVSLIGLGISPLSKHFFDL